jgi:DNA-binding FadR family transcriptional regulator
MPKIEPPQSRSERVADQLRDRITAGEFPVGALIPTEKDLAEETGVSRNCVREAVHALVHAGMLASRAGYGTYVTDTSDLAPTLARHIDREREQDVAEVRAILEREGARLAARHAGDDEITALRGALAARTDAAADIAFHRTLLAASGNALLAELYRGVGGNELALETCGTDGESPEMAAAHADIVTAVAAGDEAAAVAAADRLTGLVAVVSGRADLPEEDA